MTSIATRRPQGRIVPALEIATVIASLLLGAAFGARLLAERTDDGVAGAPAAAEQARA